MISAFIVAEQGPRVTHHWWVRLTKCHGKNFAERPIQAYATHLFADGLEKLVNAPDAAALISDNFSVYAKRSKTIPASVTGTQQLDVDNIHNITGIKKSDIVAVCIALGYADNCSNLEAA